MLPQLRRRGRRGRAYDPLGPRTVAQPDDGPHRQPGRHGTDRQTLKRMGIGQHEPYLSTALGAGTTTVEKMVNAFSMLPNHGRSRNPTLIAYVQRPDERRVRR